MPQNRGVSNMQGAPIHEQNDEQQPGHWASLVGWLLGHISSRTCLNSTEPVAIVPGPHAAVVGFEAHPENSITTENKKTAPKVLRRTALTQRNARNAHQVNPPA